MNIIVLLGRVRDTLSYRAYFCGPVSIKKYILFIEDPHPNQAFTLINSNFYHNEQEGPHLLVGLTSPHRHS